MLLLLLTLCLAGIFLALAGLHVYWAAGGRVGSVVAVPEAAGQPIFQPSAGATVVVALGLGAAALVVLAAGGYRLALLPAAWVTPGTWALAGLFGLRALGDFRYVGFSKRLRDTRFARNDTRYYSPLCLAIAGGCALLAVHAG